MNNDRDRIPIEIPRGTEEGGGCLECFMLQIGLELNKEETMSFKVGRLAGTVLVISLLIQMQIAENGHAAFGAKIAFYSTRDGNSEIYVMDGDGRNQRRVTVDPAADFLPAWSPDGRKIAFVSNRTNRNKHIKQIWVIDADGKNPIRLTDGLGDSNPDWSPDGTKILYDAHLDPEAHIGDDGITVMDAAGNNKRLLTEEGAHPSWSPDGKRIVYTHGQIYVMDADGGNRTQLTHDVGFKRMPSWSPDGRSIAYMANSRIWVMDSDGENQEQLTKINWDNHPTWSPESDAIAFQSWRDGGPRIYTVDVTSGAVNVMQHARRFGDGQPDWHYPGAFSVSPEGSRITIWGRLKNTALSLR